MSDAWSVQVMSLNEQVSIRPTSLDMIDGTNILWRIFTDYWLFHCSQALLIHWSNLQSNEHVDTLWGKDDLYNRSKHGSHLLCFLDCEWWKKDLRRLILDMSQDKLRGLWRYFIYLCILVNNAIQELCDISDYSRSAVFVILSAFYRMSVGSF